MGSAGESLDRWLDDRAQEYDGERPGDHVAQRLHQRRLARASAAIAAPAVALVAIVIGGLAWAVPDDTQQAAPTPSPTPDLTIDRGPVSIATVPFPTRADLIAREMPVPCGAPAPEPVEFDGDFQALYALPETAVLPRDGSASLGQDTVNVRVFGNVAQDVPVTLADPIGIFVRDGVVVGWAPPFWEPSLTRFTPGRMVEKSWPWAGYALDCEEFAADRIVELEAGDYDVYFVTQVYASEAVNASASLRADGYEVPMAESLIAYREGSYECSALEFTGSLVPITCAPDALVGTEVDLEAGTVTFPYVSAAYERDVDVRFVSEPMRVELGPRAQVPQDVVAAEFPPPAPDEELACGMTFVNLDTSVPAMSWGPRPLPARDGDVIDLTVWAYTDNWEWFELTVPEQVRIWVVQSMVFGAPDNGGDVPGEEVIGWLDVAPESTTVAVDRYTGPTTWPVEVSDVQWCDEAPRVDDTFSPTITGYITAPHTVADASGVRDEDAAIWVGP